MKCLFRLPHPSGLWCLLALVIMPELSPAGPAQTNPPSAKAEVQAHYGQLPLSFEVNRGQTDSQVKFLARGHGYGLFLTPTEAVLSLQRPPAKSSSATPTGSVPEISGAVLRMQWAGGNSAPRVVGREAAPGRVNYLIGKNPAHWHTSVPTYARIAYEGVYPGVDLVYYGHQGQLEYDVVVAPKADPRAIRLTFRGTDRMEVSAAGELVLHRGKREIKMHRPDIYQELAGIRKSIAGGYTLNAAREVGFDIGAYDRSHPLVIDPVLAYATYLGGNDRDWGSGIAVDIAGHAYVTGYAGSANFPTTAGAFQEDFDRFGDAFVTKLNPAGTALEYATYLGGASNQGSYGQDIAVDITGSAYVTGYTKSHNFPTTVGAFQENPGGLGLGIYDAFVAKLNPTGTALDYSTYLGGSRSDRSSGIAIDIAGHAYVTGSTGSANFPTTAGAFQKNYGGGGDVDIGVTGDAFVAKLNPAGTALDYATYLGGSLVDGGSAIAVDIAGHAYVTGYTESANFPTTAGVFQAIYGGGYFDAFVAKLNPGGTVLNYATYLGSSSVDWGSAIAADNTGHAYVTGSTHSANFPTTAGAFQEIYGGGYDDAFVAKLNPAGTALNYATYLGGNSEDSGSGIAIDIAGHAYVTGSTGSANFPTTEGAFQENLDGGIYINDGDAFVAKLNPDGNILNYATYLGGNLGDYGSAIAIDIAGDAYVTGSTGSANFPTTMRAFQEIYGSDEIDGYQGDAFVAKLNIVGPSINKEPCKNGGRKIFNNPAFKNQGKCLSFVEHHKKDGNNHHSHHHP